MLFSLFGQSIKKKKYIYKTYNLILINLLKILIKKKKIYNTIKHFFSFFFYNKYVL